jgi:site-specific DNA-adenine methylase
MAQYGIPYMGSKGSIAEKIIKLFPNADNFYDLFGGGFSITHAMLKNRSNDYKEFHFNEIHPGVIRVIKNAISGNYNYEVFKPKFISKKEFDENKDDFYINIVWSFGNRCDSYLFSKVIETYKRSMHNAIVFNEFDELAKQVLGMNKFNDNYSINQKRLFLSNKIEYYRTTKIPDILLKFLSESQLERLEQLQQLQQLQQLERLQQLQRLERLEQLHIYNKSYNEIDIKENSIIYCDPPYKNTTKYISGKFNTEKFLDWCNNQKNPVFISEYDVSDKRFSVIASFKKRSLLGDKKEDGYEKVYVNEAGKKYLKLNGML